MMQTEIAESPKVVVIGGGTGSFMLLSQLKHYVSNLTALVNMVDNGGSTGVLRDELGVLPPGDIRQCLVALSRSPQVMRDLFNYRFPNGSFAGHSFGNIFISAVQKMTDNFDDGVELAGQVLNIQGRVLPMTLTDCHLLMDLHGEKVEGEININAHAIPDGVTPKMSLTPKATINPRAKQAIAEADLVVIAPGNLYCSLIPALLIDGVREAIAESNAKVVYVCNLVNKAHQATNFKVHDYVTELERYIGKGEIDYVLYNTDKPNAATLKKYAGEGETLVGIDEDVLQTAQYTAKGGSFLAKNDPVKNDPNDKLFTQVARNLIRHDADALSRALMRIYFS